MDAADKNTQLRDDFMYGRFSRINIDNRILKMEHYEWNTDKNSS
jgi:hypothetical protein